MDAQVKARLLAAIAAGRLVILCGAGLSMAPPSNLPSARRVAEDCFDRYRLEVDPQCDPALRTNLEAFAEHFVRLNNLQSYFISTLVPWKSLVRQPNPGHAAVADFLLTGAAAAGLSTNYDILIERTAWNYGADFEIALDGDEATAQTVRHKPLLKFHGCAVRDRQSTVWTKSQLNDLVISGRIAKSRTWMAANLRQKDLLVVGFWSDWDYLNEILDAALRGIVPLSVTVVDLSPTGDLQQKAPDLWAVAHQEHVTFTHIQESGADVLDELRRAFSANYLRSVLAAGQSSFEQSEGVQCQPEWLQVGDSDSEMLYAWRRDAEGVPASAPARQIRPGQCSAVGYFHLLLRRAGAQEYEGGYLHQGRLVRVVNGGSEILSEVRARFIEAPPIAIGQLVFVAVGATDTGLPGNVMRPGREGDVIRPAPSGIWMDLQQARVELNV